MLSKILDWLHRHVWPWTEILRLNKELLKTSLDLESALREVQSYLKENIAHRGNWLAIANQHWSSKPFTEEERTQMLCFYGEGYGWREALNLLKIYTGRIM